jgi:hypothetical protein
MILAWWPLWTVVLDTAAVLLPALLPELFVVVMVLSELSEACRYGNVLIRLDGVCAHCPITKCYKLYPITLTPSGKASYTLGIDSCF